MIQIFLGRLGRLSRLSSLPLLNALPDTSKLSQHALGLTLALALAGGTGSNVGVAEAKDKTEEPAKIATHHPPGDDCMPPGPPGGPMFGRPPGPPPPPMALPLMGVDLSDEQIDKLSQLNASFRERLGPSMSKMHSLEQQFRIALTSASINVEEVNALSGKIAAEKVNVDSAIGDLAIAQAQVLTPEQRHKIKIDMEKFEIRGGFGPHFGPHI